jgi:hypothetical protein
MVKKKILRLAEGIELENEVIENLKEILDEFQIEYYSPVPDLKRSYKRRMHSLHKAFLFILDSIPEFEPNRTQLIQYLNWCQTFCSLPEDKLLLINDYQKLLGKYISLLLTALVDCYPMNKEFRDHTKNSADCVKEATDFAIELLNKAEQYVIMKKGRSDIATLIPMEFDNYAGFVLRWEEQLTPYTEEAFQEFKAIRDYAVEVPAWFAQLLPVWQMYLHFCFPLDFLNGSNNALCAIKFNLNVFTIQWGKIKKEHALTLDTDLKSIAANESPPWLFSFSKEHQALLKLFCELNENVATITESIENFNKTLQDWGGETNADHSSKEFWVNEWFILRKLPYWFLILKDFEQRFLKASLKDSHSDTDLKNCISFAPSRLRRLPLLANFCQTKLFLLSLQGKITKIYSARLRSSHLASRDVTTLPVQVQKLHAQRNLETIIKQLAPSQPLLVQTLISPISFLERYIPDYYLDQQRQEAIANFKKNNNNLIFSTNHPLNAAKYVYYTQENAPYCTALLNTAHIILLLREVADSSFPRELKKIQQIVAEAYAELKAEKENKTPPSPREAHKGCRTSLKNLFKKNYQLLQQIPHWQSLFVQHLHEKITISKEDQREEYNANLLNLHYLAKEYYKALNSSYGSATVLDFYGRELFLSSLENLIIAAMKGKSYGSCVSGKDRKEVIETHTLAMELYREKKKCWPSLSDVGNERAEFVNIVVNLWSTWHGYELAGQNAEGSDGIKTPYNYWPSDIAAAICQKVGPNALTDSDILATNNEVGKIKNVLIKPGFTHYLLSAQIIQKEERERIINTLGALCAETTFLSSKTWSGPWLQFFQKGTPTGLEEIKKILAARENDEANSIHKLAQIYFEISQRPKESWARAEVVQSLYEAILKLYQEPQNGDSVIKNIAVLGKIKEIAFQPHSNAIMIH